MAQAFATALLNEWGGGVQKDAGLKDTILKKTIGKGVEGVMRRLASTGGSAAARGAASGVASAAAKQVATNGARQIAGTGARQLLGNAGKKVVGNIAANQSSGVAGTGVSGVARGALRSLAGVKPGAKTFNKPLDYVTKPLKATLLPNLGRGLNRTRAGLLTGFVGYEGNQAYGAVGDTAKKMQEAAQTARMAGASNQTINDMNRYTTRAGIVQGWLRGNGWGNKWLAGTSNTDAQRELDRALAREANLKIFKGLEGYHSSWIKPHEYLNPFGGALMRGITNRIGSAGVNSPEQLKTQQMNNDLQAMLEENTTSNERKSLSDLWARHDGAGVSDSEAGELSAIGRGIRDRFRANQTID